MELETDHHIVSVDELCERFNTDISEGLTYEQTVKNREQSGENVLTPTHPSDTTNKFVKCFFSDFALLQWVGAVLCFAAYAIEYEKPQVGDNLFLGILLTAFVTVTGMFSYHQESKESLPEKVMRKYQDYISQYASVRRNGGTYIVCSSELVCGDIIEIEEGDRIPADVRIIECSGINGLIVHNQKSGSLYKSTEFTHKNPLETKNLAFLFDYVLEGTAVGMVVQTGDNTWAGRSGRVNSGLKCGQTPFAKEIENFINILCIVAVFLGIGFFFIAMTLGYSWHDAVFFLVGIAVGNVSYGGLLAALPVCHILAAKRFYYRNAVYKNQEAVETLGDMCCLLTNKTGVVTQGRMTVAHMWFDNKIWEADTSDDPRRTSYSSSEWKALSWAALERVACLCNSAEFKEGQDWTSVWKKEVNGSATEGAILKCTELSMGNVTEYRARNKKVCNIPFLSTKRFQVSIHETEDPNEERYLMVMKGAPEEILERCITILSAGTEHPLSQEWKEAIDEAVMKLAGQGERVLAFCDLMLPTNKYPKSHAFSNCLLDDELKGLRFVGLMSMIDPPRAAVPDSIYKLRQAGVKLIMVTGDHPITAKELARSIGIISEGNETVEDIAMRTGISDVNVNPRDARAAVVKGRNNDLTEADLEEILLYHSEIVFARTSPDQKLAIVEACQRRALGGVRLAFFGSHASDTPAVKKADMGLVMGISGSPVVKNAADVMLLDDNYASIVTGIEVGRLLFDNMKKSVNFNLISSIIEIFFFLLFILTDMSIVIGTVTIYTLALGLGYILHESWGIYVEHSNFGSFSLPDFSMTKIMGLIVGNAAYEFANRKIMKRNPRNPEMDKLTGGATISIAVILKIASTILSGIIIMKRSSVFLTWIVIKEMSRGFMFLIVNWEDTDPMEFLFNICHCVLRAIVWILPESWFE